MGRAFKKENSHTRRGESCLKIGVGEGKNGLEIFLKSKIMCGEFRPRADSKIVFSLIWKYLELY